MSIYMCFENESMWYMSPETPMVHVVTQLWWRRCFAGEQQPTIASSLLQRLIRGEGAAPALQPQSLG